MSRLSEEIAEQPEVLARLLTDQAGPIGELTAALERRPPRFVVLAARGSSDNAARYAQHLLGRFCGLPVALATPSLQTLYGASPRLEDALVIGISQSGASPDVSAVVADAAAQGQATVAVTNDLASPLAEAAQHAIALGTGPERSVAATKTYTASLGALALLAARLSGDPGLEAELRRVPEAMEAQLARGDELGPAVDAAKGWERCAVVGRGANYGTAFEAALKVKELSGLAAEPYSPPDLLHGPIASVGAEHPVLAIAPSGPTHAGMGELLAAIRERGAGAVVVSDDLAGLGDTGAIGIGLEATPEWLSPLVAILPAQLLAAGVTQARGLDLDAPFGLTKVTRTL